MLKEVDWKHSNCATKRRATILVVDDDQTLPGLISMLLTREGYSVIAANSGEVVLKISTSCSNIDLLLTDVEMPPGMSGLVLARCMKTQSAQLSVLIMSGRDRADLKLEKERGFLAKPFSVDELRCAVADILGPAFGVGDRGKPPTGPNTRNANARNHTDGFCK